MNQHEDTENTTEPTCDRDEQKKGAAPSMLSQ